MVLSHLEDSGMVGETGGNGQEAQARWIWILWPAFVLSIPTTGLVFSLVDPAELRFHGSLLEASSVTAALLVFLGLWALGAACSALTCVLQRTSPEATNCPLAMGARPPGCPEGDASHGCD
jgi:hypothetical protein